MKRRNLVAACAAVTSLLACLAPAAQADPVGPQIVDASLYAGGQPCSATTPPVVVNEFGRDLQVVATDDLPNSYPANLTFAVWPSADPSAETRVTTRYYSVGWLTTEVLPEATLTSGTDYSWRVQLSDGNGVSPWSRTCTFHYDSTPPPVPTVTSSNFPADYTGRGPVGQMPEFTFDGGGDPDTVGFAWGWWNLGVPACSSSGPNGQIVCPDPFSRPNTLRADRPGGTASLKVNVPSAGPTRLAVAAIDAAGNQSPATYYDFFMPSSFPTVTLNQQPLCGSTAVFKLSPHADVTDVTSYSYTLEGWGPDETGTVKARPDGTATVQVKVSANYFRFSAVSNSANGFISTAGYSFLNVNPQATVQSDVYQSTGQPTGGPGVTGTFTFSPPYNTDWVASYRYQFGSGQTETIASSDGSEDASIQWTPVHSGAETLTVTALTDSGAPVSCPLTYDFVVADRAK